MSEQSKKIKAELARREIAKRYYSEYLIYTHGKTWKRTRMSEYIAMKVQDFLETDTGHAYDIMVIETPPQHGKSMTVTETLPSWYLGNHPDKRVIVGCYDSVFAEKFCRRNKEKIKDYGANIFGLSIGKIDRSDEFELNEGKGGMIARGIMAGITGNPGDLIIIDDPVKNRQEADSPTYRSRVWEEWQSSIKSRLQANAKIIIIMTPWHEDDLAARVLKMEPNVTLLRLPIEAEANDPLGRAVGDALCPELGKDNAWLADFKKSYINDMEGGGARSWSALYQCSPRVEQGNIIHRDWWRYYDPNEPRIFGAEVISVDAAFKDGDKNDYVSIQVWGKCRQDYYLRYCVNEHLNFPNTVARIRAIASRYPRARSVLIEDKANGSAIIQTLQRELFCIPVNPLGGKVARVNAVSAAIESGHVFLPQPAPDTTWVEAFIDQFSAFPNAAHDDMVDAASQALQRLIYASGTLEVAQYDEAELQMQRVEEAFNNPDQLFDPYGINRVFA